jgi:hypothetical protein
MACSSFGRLGFVFTCLWRLVVSQTTYVEDVIYMMEQDTKVIRLKDFMPSGIMTNFTFEPVDPLENSTQGAIPETMSISPSQTYLFNLPSTDIKYANSTSIDLKNVSDMNSGLDHFFLALNTSSFNLLFLSGNNSLMAKKSITENAFKPLTALIDESHHFLFFSNFNGTSTILKMKYFFLDTLSEDLLMPKTEVDLVVDEEYFPADYKFNVNRSASNDYEIFGYHSSSFTKAALPQFIYIKVHSQNDKFEPTKKRMSLAFKGALTLETLKANYQMVSAGLVAFPKIRMVIKAIGVSGNSNRYYTTDCTVQDSQTEAAVAQCEDPKEITTFRLLANTLNRGIDLGYGRFGIITEKFLLYPADDDLSRFEKIYLKINVAYVKSTDPLEIKFSVKNDKFIALALGNKDSVKEFYIIEYLSNPPEVNYNSDARSTYFRLQKSTLFMNSEKDNIKNLQAVSFQDAYISFEGKVVGSKKGGINKANIMDSLQFAIQSKSSDVQKQKKNFTVNLVHKVLEAIDLNVPYKEVKVTRGGHIAIAIKEENFVGNNILMNVTTTVPNVKTSVQPNSKKTIQFTNFDSANLSSKVKFIKLLYDNLLLVVREETDNQEYARVCFLKADAPDKMNCSLKHTIKIDASHEVKNAWLLNFDHIILVIRYKNTTSNSTGNEWYKAGIYNLATSSLIMADGGLFSFYLMAPGTEKINLKRSYICYTYSASAVITYIKKDAPNTKLFVIKFSQEKGGNYSVKELAVTFDQSLIKSLENFVPDYPSKYYFYVGFTDKSDRYITYQAMIKNNANTFTLVKVKELSSSLTNGSSANSVLRYCAGLQELIAIGKTETSQRLGTTVERIISVPFKVKYPVYEKMVRRLPLESLDLTHVEEYACLSHHNSLIVLAYHYNETTKKQTRPTLVNYDLDLIHDPRRRIEQVTELPNLILKDVMMTASSNSYAFKDFLVISALKDEAKTDREFYFITQSIKDINFEVYCPFSSPDKIPLDLTLYTPNLAKPVTKVQQLSLIVKPLDYSTNIRIRSTGKLEKKVGKYPLEKLGLMTIEGHFFDVKLVNTSNPLQVLSKESKSSVYIQNRLTNSERFLVQNSLEIKKINDTYVLREVTGNIGIYPSKGNRSKRLNLAMQCNSLNADFVYNWMHQKQFFIFTVEDVIGGVIATYRQIDSIELAKTENIETATTKQFTQTYEGIYGTPSSLYCGKNFFFYMYSKVNNELRLSVIRPDDVEGKVVQSSVSITIPLPEIPIASELVCFYDSEEPLASRNSSVALIVVYQNQTQVLYRYNGETELSKVKQALVNFEIKDKIFFIDVECDVSESKRKPGEQWNIVFKCFYSTRWSNDLIVLHVIESSPSSLAVTKSTLVQEVQEIKDFEIAKIIMEDNRVLVAGFNMKEKGSNRKVYILVYNFTMDAPTYVTSFFTIDSFMDLDYDRFRQLIHVSNDGSVVYLDKDIADSNTFNYACTLEIDSIILNIDSTAHFNPNEISLEVTDLGGTVMEKISLFSFFNYDAEIAKQAKHPLASLMTYCLLASGGLLVVSVISYMVINRIYEKKMAAVTKASATSMVRDSIREARLSIIADIDLADDDGHDLVSELMKSSHVELELK